MRERAVVWVSWLTVAAIGMAIIYLFFISKNNHKRGLCLASAGALLLAVDPIKSVFEKLGYSQRDYGDRFLGLKDISREQQIDALLEHSWPSYLATLGGTALLTIGFLLDYSGED